MSVSEVEVREGYRMTELGEFPEEWGLVQLEGVAEVNAVGCNPTEEFAGEHFPYLDISSVAENAGGILGVEMTPTDSAPSRARRVVRTNDVIMSTVRPYLKAYALVGTEHDGSVCSTGFAVLSVKNETVPAFLLYALLSPAIQTQFRRHMRGVNYPALNIGHVKQTVIPLPAPTEQKKIAAVLQTVQQAKERTEAVIQAARELKKSLLKYLFTYGPVPVDQAEDVELKDTIFGQVRTDWATQSLGDIADSQYGYTESACEDPVGPKFLRITDINDEGYVSWPSVPYCPIGDDDFEKYRLVDGDILVARIGATTGKTTIVKDAPESVFASYLIRLQLAAECGVKPEYAFYFTQSPAYWSQVIAVRGGKLKGGISASVLKQLQLPVPSLDKQTEIDSFLSAVDSKIVAEEDHRRALEELFNTLLNDLMTAKLRVNDLDLGE